MGDLQTLHQESRKLAHIIHEGLIELQEIEAGSRQGDIQSVASELRKKQSHLQRTVHELESVWRIYLTREHPDKRAVWKRKVEQVVEELEVIRRELDKYGTREQRRAAERQQRDELFERSDLGRRAKAEMDDDDAAASAMQGAWRGLEEMFSTGATILGNMSTTRDRLKAAQRKTLDVLNSLGMGETLLKLIERRQRMDIYMTYGGMVVVLLLVILFMWIFWR